MTVAALLALGGPAAAQQDFEAVEIETSDLGGGIHMLVGEGGNIGVSAGEDGVFVVDDQFAPLTEKILAAIGEFSDEPPAYVVNTHWHFDHTGGNENMGKAGAVIVAHENVRTRMSTDQFIEAFQREVPASPAIALPVVTFSNDVTFHYNGTEIRVMHRPAAHTDGDAVVMFVEQNVLHTGDLFFNRLFPFIDGSSGGSIEGMIDATDSLLGLVDEETQIIPGTRSARHARRSRELSRHARRGAGTRCSRRSTRARIARRCWPPRRSPPCQGSCPLPYPSIFPERGARESELWAIRLNESRRC